MSETIALESLLPDAERLVALLKDPHPGLLSWQWAVRDVLGDIAIKTKPEPNVGTPPSAATRVVFWKRSRYEGDTYEVEVNERNELVRLLAVWVNGKDMLPGMWRWQMEDQALRSWPDRGLIVDGPDPHITPTHFITASPIPRAPSPETAPSFEPRDDVAD